MVGNKTIKAIRKATNLLWFSVTKCDCFFLVPGVCWMLYSRLAKPLIYNNTGLHPVLVPPTSTSPDHVQYIRLTWQFTKLLIIYIQNFFKMSATTIFPLYKRQSWRWRFLQTIKKYAQLDGDNQELLLIYKTDSSVFIKNLN